ncbi:MAG TPA: PTS sugar transporter subunit IIB [Erysipelotrichaceae bacterium]|nr:PTS sugar transporter subunit IIB [Erysipelotrichaceae bacterium]
MKIMLICAGGMSTSILMKKMEKWGLEKNRALEVKAFGLSEYEENWKGYDIVLLGPQISYKATEIQNNISIQVSQIQSFDYAVGNVENIMKQVDALLNK